MTAVALDIPDDPCDPPRTYQTYLGLTLNGRVSPFQTLGPGYQAYSHTWTTNPAAGQAWTVAEVNGLEAGVQRYRLDPVFGSETQVTQLYVTVVQTIDTYTYNNAPTGMNELPEIDGPGAASFTYTANGDLWTKTAGGATWTYTYNEMGLLKEVKEGSTVRATYFYDGLGRRVKATEDGVTTFFVYGLGLDPLWTKSGTSETRHVYANGLRVARMGVGGPTYYHLDRMGSTWRMTDAAKATVLSTSYEPFGQAWGTTGPLAASERHGFPGERRDRASLLLYDLVNSHLT